MTANTNIQLWAGTEAAHEEYEAQDRLLSALPADVHAARQLAWDDDEEERRKKPRLLAVNDGVAVIRIAGALVSEDSWRNEFLGRTGYPEVRAALVHAASDATVGSIVLDIGSGGGHVHGMTDTADLIASIDKKVKPVYAFTDTSMCSAAYYLGSAARKVTLSKMADMGSVGVVHIHKELTKAFEQEGITVEVTRAGKYKALGNPYEKLSDLAREEIQASVDQSYSIFVQHVADQRKVSYQVADTKMAQGRVFQGQAAVDVGLADRIGNFDLVMSDAQRAKPGTSPYTPGIPFSKGQSQYAAHSDQGLTVKQALTEQQIAALVEAGLPLTDVQANLNLSPKGEEQPAGKKAESGDGEKPNGEGEGGNKAADADTKAANPEVLGYVQGQLADAQKQVIDLTMKLRDAEAKLEAAQKSVASMRPITVASVDRLRIALGHSAGAAESMSDTELLAAHSSLREQFETKFKSGGVAAVSPAPSDKKGGDEAADQLRMARIKAARLTK